MPRFEFKEENIRKNDYDYPKFKLEKGETARIVMLEDPWGEYVHTLRKPKLVGGVAVKEQKKRRDGTYYEDYEYEFVAQALCTGDAGVLQEDGSDPKGCPICAEAVKSDKFPAPKLRYAVHVVEYDTKPDGSVKESPFGASTKVWGFTERVFGELYGFKKEWKDLRQHDLIVYRDPSTMTTGVYKISVAATAAWTQDEKRQQYIKELIAPENLAPDLAIFCGSRKSEAKLGYDIAAINEAWAIATGVQGLRGNDAEIAQVGSLGLNQGISDLLTQTKTDEAGWHKEDVAPAPSPESLGIDSSEPASDDEITKLLGILGK